jgi:3-isopropylmalate/(R)-2-methylmalate dehydratase large subunit
MGMTIAEKIIARAAKVEEAHAGNIYVVELDHLMSNDGTTHLTIDMYNKLKNKRIFDKSKLVWIVDHNVPCDSPKTAASCRDHSWRRLRARATSKALMSCSHS